MTPVIVIIGPTASGKTSLSVKLAKQFGGEIISADSRAIYKYMDIGTAKPTVAEQGGVPHHGIDLVAPDERFTVHDFQQYAVAKIAEIRGRGKIPFLVGGTGLYVDAVIYGYDFEGGDNRAEMLPGFVVVGITMERTELKRRIAARAKEMFEAGVVKETTFLAERYSWDSEPMKSNVYRVAKKYASGEISLEQAIADVARLDAGLAKRQMTWFRRNPNIHWLDAGAASEYISCLLR